MTGGTTQTNETMVGQTKLHHSKIGNTKKTLTNSKIKGIFDRNQALYSQSLLPYSLVSVLLVFTVRLLVKNSVREFPAGQENSIRPLRETQLGKTNSIILEYQSRRWI
jgi:hypothetical protein